MEIKNSEIIVTGTSRGIGKALAEALAKRNAKLHLVNRTPQNDWISHYKNFGARSVTNWQADMSNPESINNFINEFLKSGVQPEILINNSGILIGGQLETQSLNKIYEMYQINLAAFTHLTHAFLPIMLKNKKGKIVNNASMSGVSHLPCNSTYSATKAGVVAFTNALRQELHNTGVSTLLLITPAVQTDMWDEIPGMFQKNFKHLELSAIPANEWAAQVCNCIENDKDLCEPSGISWLRIFVCKHFPSIAEKYVRYHFARLD